MARTHLKLDERLIEELAGLGCTMPDIARVLNCSVDTLERNYMDVVNSGRASAKVSIRRKQMQVALDDEHKSQGTMLVWLGKILCDQWETNTFLSKLPLDALLLEIERRQKEAARQAEIEVQPIDLSDRVKAIKGSK